MIADCLPRLSAAALRHRKVPVRAWRYGCVSARKTAAPESFIGDTPCRMPFNPSWSRIAYSRRRRAPCKAPRFRAWTPIGPCARKRTRTSTGSGRAWRARTCNGPSPSRRSWTSPRRLSIGGLAMANSTYRPTAWTCTCITATPTRPPSSSNPTTARSTRSATANCWRACAASPMA
ncbi:Uncharacterised protein [Bordetella pertussis]|nr:Uncharacterised protein [Bordetella pertussis]